MSLNKEETIALALENIRESKQVVQSNFFGVIVDITEPKIY